MNLDSETVDGIWRDQIKREIDKLCEHCAAEIRVNYAPYTSIEWYHKLGEIDPAADKDDWFKPIACSAGLLHKMLGVGKNALAEAESKRIRKCNECGGVGCIVCRKGALQDKQEMARIEDAKAAHRWMMDKIGSFSDWSKLAEWYRIVLRFGVEYGRTIAAETKGAPEQTERFAALELEP